MKNITIILLLSITILFTGCKDFLDVKPQGLITQQAFPTTPEDALLATNGVYASLRSWHYHSGGYPILDIMSDDTRKGSNPNDQASNLNPYDNFTFTTTQDGLDRWWATLYEGIKRANVVLEKVPSIIMDEELKNRYLAEASFLRALYYFDLRKVRISIKFFLRLENTISFVSIECPNGQANAGLGHRYAIAQISSHEHRVNSAVTTNCKHFVVDGGAY